MTSEARNGDDLHCHVLLFRYRGLLWSRCRMRKDMEGYWGGLVRAGTWGYRPVTNGKDRMKRLRDVPQLAQILEKQNAKLSVSEPQANESAQAFC